MKILRYSGEAIELFTRQDVAEAQALLPDFEMERIGVIDFMFTRKTLDAITTP